MNADERDGEKEAGRQDPVDTIPVRPTGGKFFCFHGCHGNTALSIQ